VEKGVALLTDEQQCTQRSQALSAAFRQYAAGEIVDFLQSRLDNARQESQHPEDSAGAG